MAQNAGVELHINQLEKSYGHLAVLQKIDLNIESGEFVAIVGKSGCGKSTLLRHISGLEKASGGGIKQNQHALKGLNDQARIMFQDARLLSWLSVLENTGVGLGLEKGWKNRAYWALQQVGLEQRAEDWPAILSGGQKQRVALARALASNPRLMLLDEPLGALDALTRMEMQALIEDLWLEQQFTAILVTHDMNEAITLADRVILIEEGAVKLDLPVDLQRPRNRLNPAFAELEEELLANVLGKKRLHQHEPRLRKVESK
ncbi:ATP-binding cassette domain-containing protein [Oceanobacillus sojae]|uniref:ATP-binding cassette domain-containing protein n=1 Tax=Oceanobacillus sojae TaxID=582851 RepID=UPI0021A79544|nr:ATP-binding cassette domain-containing protein [Oceanobacillus sojae]MCT1902572.1 ATP-binding cassette domain-containing protein [Oceanobacillus sojae]